MTVLVALPRHAYVHMILDTVVRALAADKNRTFTYVGAGTDPVVNGGVIGAVDERNPAPVDIWFVTFFFIEFQPSKLVQDFLHPVWLSVFALFHGNPELRIEFP